MKYLVLLPLFLLSGWGCAAQGTFNNTGSGLNDLRRYMNDDDTLTDGPAGDDEDEETGPSFSKEDPLAHISMDITDSSASFGNVPPELRSLRAHITNSDGEELEAQRITVEKSSLDIHDLPRSLFFVTLTYKNHRKAFTLDRSEKQ